VTGVQTCALPICLHENILPFINVVTYMIKNVAKPLIQVFSV
jgi:hypothetical protein